MSYDEDRKNDDIRPPIVLYCLHLFEDSTRCQLTSWYGMDHWEVSIDRISGMESGRYTAIMAPRGFCPEHREAHSSKKGA